MFEQTQHEVSIVTQNLTRNGPKKQMTTKFFKNMSETILNTTLGPISIIFWEEREKKLGQGIKNRTEDYRRDELKEKTNLSLEKKCNLFFEFAVL